MDSHELMGQAYKMMTHDMRGKLSGYQFSLESRYGDPRTYALERQMMAEEQAAVEYSRAKTHEEALSVAYGKNREQIRENHRLRMRQHLTPYTRPESREVDPTRSAYPTPEPRSADQALPS